MKCVNGYIDTNHHIVHLKNQSTTFCYKSLNTDGIIQMPKLELTKNRNNLYWEEDMTNHVCLYRVEVGVSWGRHIFISTMPSQGRTLGVEKFKKGLL